jgi:hypothetical protein
MNRYTEWIVFSIGGLVLIGAGISIVGEAIIQKAAGEAWFLLGPVGLAITNAGISCFGRGVMARVRLLASRSE